MRILSPFLSIACSLQDLFDGALVAGSVSDAVASGFRGPLRLTPAVSALKWAYQAMGISMPPGEGMAEDAEDAGSMAEVRRRTGLARFSAQRLHCKHVSARELGCRKRVPCSSLFSLHDCL